jgi:thiol-disulfide isomerase/thioredoxin
MVASLPAIAGDRIADKVRGQGVAESSPPLEQPTVLPVSGAVHMKADDLVLGVEAGGRSRAYPWWVAKNFHVVNDTVGGVPVMVAFCEQCTGAAAFRPVVDGRVLAFEVAGVYNGTIILRDRQTRTLWAPFSGRALEGRLRGRVLERLPLALTRWDEWSARHPQGEVAWAPQVLRQGHGSWYEPGKWGIVTEMGATLQAFDARLPENTLVFGLEDGDAVRAYPLDALRASGGVALDDVASRPVVMVLGGALDAAAYDRRVKGRPLTFRPARSLQAFMADDETGSEWSADGVALAGPLRGQRLRRLSGYVVEWHVWAAYHPGGGLYTGTPGPPPSAARSAEFPSLVLPTLRGGPQPVRLSGRVNLVVLWAAWCAPCAQEMPRVERLVAQRAGEGLAAVGIALHIPDDDAEKDAVRRFAAAARLTFPNFLVDEDGYTRLDALARSAGAPGLVLPMAFVTDERGRVRALLRGAEVERALAPTLDAVLRVSPAQTSR